MQVFRIHGIFSVFLSQIDPDLVLPTMRSAVEEQLNLIAVGKADFGAVLNHTIEVFKHKFLFFVKNIEGMDQLFEVSFSPIATSGKALSRYVDLPLSYKSQVERTSRW